MAGRGMDGWQTMAVTMGPHEFFTSKNTQSDWTQVARDWAKICSAAAPALSRVAPARGPAAGSRVALFPPLLHQTSRKCRFLRDDEGAGGDEVIWERVWRRNQHLTPRPAGMVNPLLIAQPPLT